MPVPEHIAGGDDCPRCRTKRFHFDSVVALGVYHGNLREAVIRMKTAHQEPLTLAIGGLLADKILRDAPTPLADAIVPIPIHWSRRISRGINQTELLSTPIAHRTGLPMLDRLLECRRKTKKQGTLGPVERAANVRGAFAISAGYDITQIKILLVDDVMTTGATINEAAKVCRKAGADLVSAVVVARGIGVD